jgi:alpha-amylase
MRIRFLMMFLVTFNFSLIAQNDVMLQAFYWDVPVDGENLKGLWWTNLEHKSSELKEMGITSIWIPAPSKGNWGIYDMGYGVYDHYDLGNYYQKGSVETRFGSRAELESMVAAMHDTTNGKPYIDVYADIILNHMYASDENSEPNPVVRQYVFDEAVRHGKQRVPYPTNEIKWMIPDAKAGEYLIRIKGYHLDFSLPAESRGYDIQVFYGEAQLDSDYSWRTDYPAEEPVKFPRSGHTIRAFIANEQDTDEYLVTVPMNTHLIIRLTAREKREGHWNWADQTRGYYPFEIIFDGSNIAPEKLEAHTNTHFFYPDRTCESEPDYTWNYRHFNPSDDDAWLEGWGKGDEIIPFTKAYGNDLNSFDSEVQQRMNRWGKWLTDQVGFDGYRLDFVRGFQEEYAASWIKNLPLLDGQQRFIVGEYWGSAPAIQAWKNNMHELGATVSVFDFPLKETLTQMCNGDENFDMRSLNHAGLIRNNRGFDVQASNVVTFLENHDTGKEHDKWVTQDWQLGYAYILTHEGKPCLFYPHLFGVDLQDMENHSKQVEIPASIMNDIRKLIHIRKTYLGGLLSVLSESGNPSPPENTSNVYVARRQGNGSTNGALVVLNNSNAAKGLWIDVNIPGWDEWNGLNLVDAIHPENSVQISDKGRVWVEAPPRGWTVYVLEHDFVSFQ